MTEAWPRAGRGNHHLLPRTISRRLFRHSGDDIDGQRESIRGLVTSHFTQYHYLYGSYGTYTTPPSNPAPRPNPRGWRRLRNTKPTVRGRRAWLCPRSANWRPSVGSSALSTTGSPVRGVFRGEHFDDRPSRLKRREYSQWRLSRSWRVKGSSLSSSICRNEKGADPLGSVESVLPNGP